MSTYESIQVVRDHVAAATHAAVMQTIAYENHCNYEFDSPQAILSFDRDFINAGIPLRRWIIGSPAHPLGCAICFRPTWYVPHYTFWVQMRMNPQAPIADSVALWETVVRWARSAGARTLHTMVHSAHSSTVPPTVVAVEYACEQVYVRAMSQELPALPVCQSPIMIHTLAELMQRDTDAIARACTLHAAISLDVPIPDEPIVTMQNFHRLIRDTIRPEQYVIVTLNGEYVAESMLHRDSHEPHVAWQHVTGVLPAYRGRRIAHHAKLAALRIAQQLGVTDVRTLVESHNTQMQHINTVFGFTPMNHPTALSRILAIDIAQ